MILLIWIRIRIHQLLWIRFRVQSLWIHIIAVRWDGEHLPGPQPGLDYGADQRHRSSTGTRSLYSIVFRLVQSVRHEFIIPNTATIPTKLSRRSRSKPPNFQIILLVPGLENPFFYYYKKPAQGFYWSAFIFFFIKILPLKHKKNTVFLFFFRCFFGWAFYRQPWLVRIHALGKCGLEKYKEIITA